MEATLKEKIKRSGIKKKHLAKQLGVSSNYFYMATNGHKKLSDERIDQLKKLLKDA